MPERCQGSWGYCDVHKKDSLSDFWAFFWICSLLSITASCLRLTALTRAKTGSGQTWSESFKGQFLHSSTSFKPKQTRAQRSDAIMSYGPICTLRHQSWRLKVRIVFSTSLLDANIHFCGWEHRKVKLSENILGTQARLLIDSTQHVVVRRPHHQCSWSD